MDIFIDRQCTTYHTSRSKIILCSAILVSVFSPNSFANLNNIPGMSGVQASTAAAIQTVCPQMGALNTDGGLSSTEQQLFFRCRELVQTSNLLQETGPSSFALPVDSSDTNKANAQLRTALQRVAPEETLTMASGATDTSHDQMAGLANRLAFLRSGSATASLASLYQINDLRGGMAGADGFSRLGLFANTVFASGNKDATAEEDGFDFDASGFLFGLDYRFTDSFIGGIALGITRSESDLHSSFGDFDTDGFNVSFYGSYYSGNFYVDGTVTLGSNDYESTRNIQYLGISQTVNSDTSADQFGASLGAGWTRNFNALSWDLSARLEYLKADIDGYTESGSELAMIVADQEAKSMQAVLGTQLSYALSYNLGVVVPYIGAQLHKEFEDEALEVTSRYAFDPTNTSFSFLSDPADTSFATLSIGSSLVLQGGTQLFFNIDSVTGLDDVRSDIFTLGFRLEL